MNNDYIVRPKVSRLPFLPAEEQHIEEKEFDGNVIWRSIYAFGVVSLFTIAFVAYNYEAGSSRKAVMSADDARLEALVNSSDDVINISNSALYFKDSSGVIVGQMVSMEPRAEKTQSGNTSDVVAVGSDAAVNYDLLAILSKH